MPFSPLVVIVKCIDYIRKLSPKPFESPRQKGFLRYISDCLASVASFITAKPNASQLRAVSEYATCNNDNEASTGQLASDVADCSDADSAPTERDGASNEIEASDCGLAIDAAERSDAGLVSTDDDVASFVIANTDSSQLRAASEDARCNNANEASQGQLTSDVADADLVTTEKDGATNQIEDIEASGGELAITATERSGVGSVTTGDDVASFITANTDVSQLRTVSEHATCNDNNEASRGQLSSDVADCPDADSVTTEQDGASNDIEAYDGELAIDAAERSDASSVTTDSDVAFSPNSDCGQSLWRSLNKSIKSLRLRVFQIPRSFTAAESSGIPECCCSNIFTLLNFTSLVSCRATCRSLGGSCFIELEREMLNMLLETKEEALTQEYIEPPFQKCQGGGLREPGDVTLFTCSPCHSTEERLSIILKRREAKRVRLEKEAAHAARCLENRELIDILAHRRRLCDDAADIAVNSNYKPTSNVGRELSDKLARRRFAEVG